jgi:hypothetical protein
LRIDRTAFAHLSRSDWEAITYEANAQKLLFCANCVTIAKRLHSGGKAFAIDYAATTQRLRSNYPAIAQRLSYDCITITQRSHIDHKANVQIAWATIAGSNCPAIAQRSCFDFAAFTD